MVTLGFIAVASQSYPLDQECWPSLHTRVWALQANDGNSQGPRDHTLWVSAEVPRVYGSDVVSAPRSLEDAWTRVRFHLSNKWALVMLNLWRKEKHVSFSSLRWMRPGIPALPSVTPAHCVCFNYIDFFVIFIHFITLICDFICVLLLIDKIL